MRTKNIIWMIAVGLIVVNVLVAMQWPFAGIIMAGVLIIVGLMIMPMC